MVVWPLKRAWESSPGNHTRPEAETQTDRVFEGADSWVRDRLLNGVLGLFSHGRLILLMLVCRVIELKRDEHYRVSCTSKGISLTLDMWVTVMKWYSEVDVMVGTVCMVSVFILSPPLPPTSTLPARFPLCGPVVHVSPPIRHQWVNAQVCRETNVKCKTFP